jgi:protein-S-isoprenylcysteine O-methyltransferase Ste14
MVQLQRHGRGQAVIALGQFFFRYRNALFPCAFALVFLPGPRLLADPLLALAIGAAFALLGQTVRGLTNGLKYIIRGGRERRVYARDLVTEGLYAHTRNPMYVGNILILIGVAVASNSWACLAIAVPLFILVYASIVAAEEDYLRREFGAAFDSYRSVVPRWNLRLNGLSRTLQGMTFHWRRLLVKEYGTLCGWIGGLSLLGLLRLAQLSGFDAHHERLRAVLIAVLALAGAGWVVAWLVKRTRIIVAD